jgi:hypothetical protein
MKLKGGVEDLLHDLETRQRKPNPQGRAAQRGRNWNSFGKVDPHHAASLAAEIDVHHVGKDGPIPLSCLKDVGRAKFKCVK